MRVDKFLFEALRRLSQAGASGLKIMLLALLVAFLASTTAGAQGFIDPVDWKEADTPPPPAFDVTKLLTIEMARSSSLVYGVDPGSFSISKSDGVVRYVMVASSASGARNVMYDGLRCSTAEVKTYARARPDGTWAVVDKPEWKSLYDLKLPRYSLRFALAGACDGAAPVGSLRELVRKMTTTTVHTPG